MFYLYILKSEKSNQYYIGISKNTEIRLKEHNNGRVKSTKRNKPWVIIHKEEYFSLSEARKREIGLKSLKKRKAIEKIIKHF